MKIIIVESHYYPEIADDLLAGARAAIEAAGFEHETITVPGALEIPQAIAIHEAKHPQENNNIHAYVALGCIIRGETYHFEVVSNESARALTDLAVSRNIAIGNGILTCENREQAQRRAGELNKGGGAAQAAIDLVKLRQAWT